MGQAKFIQTTWFDFENKTHSITLENFGKKPNQPPKKPALNSISS